jgi:hypothetical protein
MEMMTLSLAALLLWITTLGLLGQDEPTIPGVIPAIEPAPAEDPAAGKPIATEAFDQEKGVEPTATPEPQEAPETPNRIKLNLSENATITDIKGKVISLTDVGTSSPH